MRNRLVILEVFAFIIAVTRWPVNFFRRVTDGPRCVMCRRSRPELVGRMALGKIPASTLQDGACCACWAVLASAPPLGGGRLGRAQRRVWAGARRRLARLDDRTLRAVLTNARDARPCGEGFDRYGVAERPCDDEMCLLAVAVRAGLELGPSPFRDDGGRLPTGVPRQDSGERSPPPVVVALFLALAVALVFVVAGCSGGVEPPPVDAGDAPAVIDAAPDATDADVCFADGCCERCCRADNQTSANCCSAGDVTLCDWYTDAGVSP